MCEPGQPADLSLMTLLCANPQDKITLSGYAALRQAARKACARSLMHEGPPLSLRPQPLPAAALRWRRRCCAQTGPAPAHAENPGKHIVASAREVQRGEAPTLLCECEAASWKDQALVCQVQMKFLYCVRGRLLSERTRQASPRGSYGTCLLHAREAAS